jgi:hypothetical protein
LDGLDSAYGIVSDYVEWIFSKPQNDKIERDMDTLTFKLDLATDESLNRIAVMIYALLSGD